MIYTSFVHSPSSKSDLWYNYENDIETNGDFCDRSNEMEVRITKLFFPLRIKPKKKVFYAIHVLESEEVQPPDWYIE